MKTNTLLIKTPRLIGAVICVGESGIAYVVLAAAVCLFLLAGCHKPMPNLVVVTQLDSSPLTTIALKLQNKADANKS
ncbi:MAG TPA: hypothetical protein VK518_16150 [Puia sp.]|nr:hypothetical protein [Puia sp.]